MSTYVYLCTHMYINSEMPNWTESDQSGTELSWRIPAFFGFWNRLKLWMPECRCRHYFLDADAHLCTVRGLAILHIHTLVISLKNKEKTYCIYCKYSRQGRCRLKSSLSELIVYCEAIAQYIRWRNGKDWKSLEKYDIQRLLSQQHRYVIQSPNF